MKVAKGSPKHCMLVEAKVLLEEEGCLPAKGEAEIQDGGELKRKGHKLVPGGIGRFET